MTNIGGMVLTTDFDSLSNDAKGTVTLVVPGSDTVGAGALKSYTANITIGSAEGLLNASMQSSKKGSTYQGLSYNTGGSSGFRTRNGNPGPYDLFFTASHVSGNTIQVSANIVNPYGVTLTTEAGDETLTFFIRTYKQPRFS